MEAIAVVGLEDLAAVVVGVLQGIVPRALDPPVE
jgi:hypothetical protein